MDILDRPARKPRQATIYGLVDPVTHELKYVGKADCAPQRLRSHVSQAKRKATSKKAQWLNTLDADPILITLGQCSAEDWPALETRWIALARDMNASLTNTGKGGEGSKERPMDLSAARLQLTMERCKEELGEDLAKDVLSVALAIAGGASTLPADLASRVFRASFDRMSSANQAWMTVRVLSQATRRQPVDSTWVLGKWEGVPMYEPMGLVRDLFGRIVTPAMPPLRRTVRSGGVLTVDM